jgi:hypothetical protein
MNTPDHSPDATPEAPTTELPVDSAATEGSEDKPFDLSMGSRAAERIARIAGEEERTKSEGITEAQEVLRTEPEIDHAVEDHWQRLPFDRSLKFSPEVKPEIVSLVEAEDPAHRNEMVERLEGWLGIELTRSRTDQLHKLEEESNVPWSERHREMIQHRLEREQEVTPIILERALANQREEREAVRYSNLPESQRERLQRFRAEVIGELAERDDGWSPDSNDYASARQEYLQLLRGDGDRRTETEVTKEYVLEHSIGRKIVDRIWRGGKLAKTLKIGGLAGSTLLLPGVAAAVGGFYLAAEGINLAAYGIKHEYRKTMAHRRTQKHLK